ncbi:hypothetical protein DM02DRAFT_376904 [Periconia macrospinosa]|uniref:Uncharacterized protein n=1 Tax=Periconia macrospinosa TaxID=97972 RepID=A0A2V1CZ29_9PLEO|nr:hypothetical protein DM02DRAFT_376904 [Periconia macrospinosa]
MNFNDIHVRLQPLPPLISFNAFRSNPRRLAQRLPSSSCLRWSFWFVSAAGWFGGTRNQFFVFFNVFVKERVLHKYFFKNTLWRMLCPDRFCSVVHFTAEFF